MPEQVTTSMKRILGLPIRRKRLTDAEYIEHVRKNVSHAKAFGKWLVSSAAILGLGCLWFLIYFTQSFVRCILASQPVAGFSVGVSVGLILGILCIGLAVQAAHLVQQAIRVWRVDRTSELLVKYHDLLVELSESKAVSATDGAGQGGEETESGSSAAVPEPLGHKHRTSTVA